MAAPRLTEEEVHAACVNIAAQGERPTSLNLLAKLGRGSFTTIGRYLASWNVSDEAKDLGADTLPAVVKLPAELTRDGEDLIKKIWSIAKGIADEELDIQRDALKQAELATHSRVDEACKFSEAQAMKIERLEDDLLVIEAELTEEQAGHTQAVVQLNEAEKANVGLAKDNDQLQNALSGIKAELAEEQSGHAQAVNQLNEAEKVNVGLAKDNDQLQSALSGIKTELAEEQGSHAKTAAQLKEVDKANIGLTFELNELKKQVAALEEGNKAAAREKLDLIKEHAGALKQKDADIRTFDNQVHELQTSLESATQSNEQLKADLKNKESELSTRIIDLEKVAVRYETALAELDAVKAEFKAVTKTTTDAEKQVANLKGQLEVYKSLDKPGQHASDS